MMTNETLEAITAQLQAQGLAATFEYPGYIAVDLGAGYTAHFGDANGYLGGQLVREASDDGVYLLSIEVLGEPTPGIIAVIAKMRDMILAVDVIVDHLHDDLGDRLAEAFPQAKTGDEGISESARFSDAARILAFNWIDNNVAN